APVFETVPVPARPALQDLLVHIAADLILRHYTLYIWPSRIERPRMARWRSMGRGNNSPFATAFTTHVETPALSQLSLAQGAGRRAGRNPPAAGALCLWLSSGRAILFSPAVDESRHSRHV